MVNAWLGTPKTLNYRDIIGSSHVIYQEGSGWVHTLRHPPRLYVADNGSTSLLVSIYYQTRAAIGCNDICGRSMWIRPQSDNVPVDIGLMWNAALGDTFQKKP